MHRFAKVQEGESDSLRIFAYVENVDDDECMAVVKLQGKWGLFL